MPIRPYQGNDKDFPAACSEAGIKPTHRQYGKWLKGRGLARLAHELKRQQRLLGSMTEAAQ